MISCPQCGLDVPEDAVYCSRCGTGIHGEAPRRRARRWFTVLLTVLTALGIVLSTTAVWARSVALETDRFVETVGPLIEEPEVQEALATRLTNAVMEGLDIPGRVESALERVAPENLPIPATLLADPLTSGLRTFVQNRFEGLVGSEAFQSLWYSTLEVSHGAMVGLLRGGGETVSVEGDTVYLDLRPLVNDALVGIEGTLSDLFGRPIDLPAFTGERVEEIVPTLEEKLGTDLPEDFGQIPVFTSDSLEVAQDAVALVDRLVFLVVVLTLAMAVATIVLAVDKRKGALWLGVGSALALVVARRVTIRLEGSIVDLAPQGSSEGAVRDVVSTVFGSLRGFTTALLVTSVVVAVVAHLVGRPLWLRRTLEWVGKGGRGITREHPVLRWIAERADGLRIAAGVVGGVLFLFVDLSWGGVLLVGVLLAAVLVVLTYLKSLMAPASEAEPVTTA